MVIAVAMLHQESNSFNARLTAMADLEITRGAEVVHRWRDTGMPLGGALTEFKKAGSEVVGLVALTGGSGGPLAECKSVINEIVTRACEHQPEGVYLDLHGALICQSCPDVSGRLLQQLSSALGPDTPIAISLDSHANLTPEIVSAADVLVGFKTYPHVDYSPTGARAAVLLLEMLRGTLKPVVRVAKLPMIQPPETSDTSTGPLAPLVRDLAHECRADVIVDGSLFYAQPWLDIPMQGSAVAITTNGNGSLAERFATDIGNQWWQRRESFVPILLRPEEAIRLALGHQAPTVMISESADAINAGAGGDNPTLIKALLEFAGDAPGLAFICDSKTVDQTDHCNLGKECLVTLGCNTDRRFGTPFTHAFTVERRALGKFRLEGTYFNGVQQDMGGAVILRSKNIHILVGRRPVICSEPTLYRCAGLEPAKFKIVGIKSPASFRPNFAEISNFAITLDMNGASSPKFEEMPWKNVRRPLFPLDKDFPFQPLFWKGRRG